MILFPKDPPYQSPGSLVRYAGTNAEGLALYQCTLWFGGRCRVSIIRTPGPKPELEHLQSIYAAHPALWTAISGPTTA